MRRCCKRHRADIWRRVEAKHCSSLCSQSEGGEYCGGQARAENPTKSWPAALAMFATCSWPSLCEQSELQCWRRNRRLCGSVQIFAARALPLTFDISIMNTLPYRGGCCRLSATLIFLEFEHPISRGCLLSTTYGGAMRFSFIRTSCKRYVKPLLAYLLV